MRFDIMLQSLLNRGDVPGRDAAIDQLLPTVSDGTSTTTPKFNEQENRWEIEIGTLDQLRMLAGCRTVALRFEPFSSPDPHLLIIEDDLDG